MDSSPNLEFDTAVHVTPSEEYAILPSSPTATNLLPPQAMSRMSDVPNLEFDTAVQLAPSEEYAILPCSPPATNLLLPYAMA